jgi:hypothetical protein
MTGQASDKVEEKSAETLARNASSTQAVLDVMARLRDRERGCPWDVEQTFATIAPYTIEEAYEVADAIERNDMKAIFCSRSPSTRAWPKSKPRSISPTSPRRSPTK